MQYMISLKSKKGGAGSNPGSRGRSSQKNHGLAKQLKLRIKRKDHIRDIVYFDRKKSRYIYLLKIHIQLYLIKLEFSFKKGGEFLSIGFLEAGVFEKKSSIDNSAIIERARGASSAGCAGGHTQPSARGCGGMHTWGTARGAKLKILI